MRDIGRGANAGRHACLILLVLGAAVAARGQSAEAARDLPPGETLEREIASGERHFYKVTLKRDDLLRVSVEQKGAEVVVGLLNAQGKLIRVDNQKGGSGTELLYDLTAADGLHWLAVVAADGAARGRYAVTYGNRLTSDAEKRLIVGGLIAAAAELNKGKEYERSIQFYEKAVSIWRELAAPLEEAQTLSALGWVFESAKQIDRALDCSRQALAIYQKLNKRDAEAFEHVAAAWRYVDQEQPREALEHIRQSLGYLRESKNIAVECTAISLRGHALYLLSQTAAALRDMEQALRLSREMKDRSLEAMLLRNIGTAQAELGQYDKALQTFDGALALLPGLKDEQQRLEGQLSTYQGFTHCYLELGQYDKAFDYAERALRLARETKDDYSEQNILTIIGVAYLRLGSLPRAEEYLISAEKLGRKINQRKVMALGTANLGAVYSRMKRYDKAIALFEESLPKLRELKRDRLVVVFSYYHGMVLRELGQFERAVALHTEAVELAHVTQTPKYEARARCELGLDYLAQGNFELARAQFTSALSIARQVKARDEEAAALDGLMRAWERGGESALAIFMGKRAVNLFQSTRSEIVKVDKRMQAEFVKDNEQTYRKLVEIMVAEGRISEAEQVLAMLKDEEVFSYLRRDDKVARELLQTVALTEREREALRRYDEFADKVTAIGKEFAELDVERKNYEEGLFPKQARHDELSAQLKDAVTAFQKFLDGLKAKFGEGDSRVAVIDSGLQSALKRLKADRTVIVSTIVGKDRLNLIVTTADTQRAHTVEVSEREVNRLVAEFRQALIDPRVDPRPAGQKLYDILVRPIEPDLAGVKADTIGWSLDGTLRYVPTAALWDRERGYLAERFASVVLTLASSRTIELPVSGRQSWNALGVGVSKPVEGFAPLRAVPDELDCIITDAQARTVSPAPVCQRGVLVGRKLLDDKFTLPAFENALGRFPVVHIASHFSLNPGSDKDSFLLLGGGEQKRFTVENLRGVSLADVELIVLSACNTATPGGEAANGVEIEGFGAVAQKQGAKAVIATLWSVADDSTRDLMVRFYRGYEEEVLTKAEALRRAQLAVMYGRHRPSDKSTRRGAELLVAAGVGNAHPTFAKDGNAPYAHPYYWSPFILIGNWK